MSRFLRAITLFLVTVSIARAEFVPTVAAEASSQQVSYTGPDRLISTDGLVEDPPGSGQFRFQSNAISYQSAYGTPNDEAPFVHFDFGSVRTVDHVRVWNANNPGYSWRGFRTVLVQYSDDAQRWTTLPDRLEFRRAPEDDSSFGQWISLGSGIRARYVRFACLSTWRDFGNPDIAALGRVRFYRTGRQRFFRSKSADYPLDSGVIDVTQRPYFATGNGVTDDTFAIQRAIYDGEGRNRLIYLPAGTYRITSPLRFSGNTSANRNSLFGFGHLAGAGRERTVIRLDANRLTNPNLPAPVIHNGLLSFWNGQFEETTADWFHNSLSDFTLEIGPGNPGATGIEFFSNNTGWVRNVTIRSADGQGAIGLDLGHADKNGPLLVKGVRVEGFRTGIRSGATVNSQTIEHVELINQSEYALDNGGQCLTVRGLTVQGPAQAVRNQYGFLVLLDASLSGSGGASAKPAISNTEFLVARRITQSGYLRTIQNGHGTGANVSGNVTATYLSHPPRLAVFPAPEDGLNLPILETPTVNATPGRQWENVLDFRRTTDTDDSDAIQRAADSGAKTIYWPSDARIVLKRDVSLPPTLDRLHGMNAFCAVVNDARIRVETGGPNPLEIQSLRNHHVLQASSRTVVVRDCEASVSATAGGNLFLENVGGTFRFRDANVWARQMNTEPEGLKVLNVNSRLWILGLKTERAGTLVATESGGITEVLGGLCYTTTSGTDPMFTITNAQASLSIAEVAYGPPPYQTLVRETQGLSTGTLVRNQAPLRYSFMNGSAIPLYCAGLPTMPMGIVPPRGGPGGRGRG
ncbi:MAG: glycosyl hydrolase family 28-related protein [Fimbriimonadaceae bacterium]|nr:glycosyl hydrolase family 28-related protein [Fimbriimonadaceae bacterium]